MDPPAHIVPIQGPSIIPVGIVGSLPLPKKHGVSKRSIANHSLIKWRKLLEFLQAQRWQNKTLNRFTNSVNRNKHGMPCLAALCRYFRASFLGIMEYVYCTTETEEDRWKRGIFLRMMLAKIPQATSFRYLLGRFLLM